MNGAAGVAAMWELGNYDRLAERLVPAAAAIAGIAGTGDGRRALDVAAGTGSLARALARRSWTVSATDIAPGLIDVGVRRAAEDGVVVDWHVAELADQPFEDASFDLVGSSFGLIFAADPLATLDELRRVLRPDGTLVFSAWTPTGYFAQMTATMAQVLPPGPPMDGPFRWGDPATALERLAPGFAVVAVATHALPWAFPSAAAAADFVFIHSPGHVAAHARAGERGGHMRSAVVEHLERLAEPDGTIDIDADFIVVNAVRRR